MAWNTGLELNLFNAVKALIVFLAFKPLTAFATLYVSTALAALHLSVNHTVKLTTLGPLGPLFEGFIVSYIPNRRSVFHTAKNLLWLVLTLWAGTGAEVLFEYGISSFSDRVTTTMLVRSTTTGSTAIAYTEGRDDIMAQVGLLERSCQNSNTLSTFTDVYVHPEFPNRTFCSPNVFSRSLCASGRTLEGNVCEPPMFPNAPQSPNQKGNWTSEKWLSLSFVSDRWRFVSDDTENDNGYVTFEPVRAKYALDGRQLFTFKITDDVAEFAIQRVHCSSGSTLLPGLKPGSIPFQVCLWVFDDSFLITHADYLNGEAKEGFLFGAGVSRVADGVREVLNNVTELEVSTVGRWISVQRHAEIVNRDEKTDSEAVAKQSLSPRDIMLALGLARPLMKFSADDGVSFSTDTYEVGLWASASMTLRLIERALVRGISIANDGDIVEAVVVSADKQIATVNVALLAQYVGTVVALGLCALFLSYRTRKAPRIGLDLEHVLGLWMQDREGRKLYGKCPKARTIALTRTDSGDNITVVESKHSSQFSSQAGEAGGDW